MTRSPAWWCGLAAFSPAATMAKLTLSWPSASSRAEMSADTCGLGAPDERDLAGVELGGDPVGGGAGGAQGGDLGGVLDHPQRADDVDGAAELGARQLRQQLDEEAGPHLVADGGRRAPRRRARRRSPIGSSVSSHGSSVNTPGCSTTRGASSRGTTSVASPSRGTTSIVSRSSGIAS